MTESEKITRKNRIDKRLQSKLLNWKIIPWKDSLDVSSLSAHAVEEYPTESGPADYALFVNGQLLGIIEAKKLTVGAENVLEQAKRYSRGVPKTVGEWRGYKVLDGDESDDLMLDNDGAYIIGLRFKGSKKDMQQAIESGFVVEI